VWRKQDIGAERTPVRGQQGPLRAALDVGRQQQAQAGRLDFEYAAAVIVFHTRIVVALPCRVEHLESHSVPLPALPSIAAIRGARRPGQPIKVGKRGHHPAHRDGLQHRCGAPGVIIVIVAYDQSVKFPDANRSQIGHDNARAAVSVRTERRSGVVEQRVARGADDHGHAVSHVEHGDAQSTAFGRSRYNQEQRQQACPAQPASGCAARREQQQNCTCRQNDGPWRRRMLRPDRYGQFAQAEKHEQAAGRDRVREPQNEVERHDRADEGGGHDQEADDRDRERISQRRHEGDLLEHGEQRRNERGSHGDLCPDKGSKPVAPANPPDRHVQDHRDRAER